MSPPSQKSSENETTPMDADASIGQSSALTSAEDAFRALEARSGWEIRGVKHLLCIYHPHGCSVCDAYVPHVLAAQQRRELNIPKRDVDHAIDAAWPRFVSLIQERAEAPLLRENEELRGRLDRYCDDLDRDDVLLKEKGQRIEQLEADVARLQKELEAAKASTLPHAPHYEGAHLASQFDWQGTTQGGNPLAGSSTTTPSSPSSGGPIRSGRNKSARTLGAPYNPRRLIQLADPPRTETGHLPRPIGKAEARVQRWSDVCPIESKEFQELLQLARSLPRDQLTLDMRIILARQNQHMRAKRAARPAAFVIGEYTPPDLAETLKLWVHNPEGIPLAIRGELDGSLNLNDLDVWIWAKKIVPKTAPGAFKKILWGIFDEFGRWASLIPVGSYPVAPKETLRESVTGPFEWANDPEKTTPADVALWLMNHAGVTRGRATDDIEPYASRLGSGEAYSPAAQTGQLKQQVARVAHRVKTGAITGLNTGGAQDAAMANEEGPSHLPYGEEPPTGTHPVAKLSASIADMELDHDAVAAGPTQ